MSIIIIALTGVIASQVTPVGPAPGTYSVAKLPIQDTGIHNGELGRFGNAPPCNAPLEWCLVDDNDGNTTYLYENGTANRATVFLSNVTIPDGASINSVQAFVWARNNTTSDPSLLIGFEYDAGPGYSSCVDLTFWPVTGLTASFSNRTKSASQCDGTRPWTSDLLDDGEFIIQVVSTNNVTITQVGLVVSYTVPPYSPLVNLELLIPIVLVMIVVVAVMILGIPDAGGWGGKK